MNSENPKPIAESELPAVSSEFAFNVYFYFAFEFLLVHRLLFGKPAMQAMLCNPSWGLRAYAFLRMAVVLPLAVALMGGAARAYVFLSMAVVLLFAVVLMGASWRLRRRGS